MLKKRQDDVYYIIQTRIADNSDSDPGNQFYPQLVGECMESNIRRKS